MPVRMVSLFLGILGAVAATQPALASSVCQLTPVAQMQVSMAGLRALASAKINGQPASLAIDTGSFFSMLGPESAARFGLRLSPLPPGLMVRGLNGVANVHYTTVKDFTLMNAPIPNAGFLVGEHQFDPDTDGVIGENILAAADDVEYDFSNGVIRFFNEKNCGDAVRAYWSAQGGYGVLSIDRIVMRSSGSGERPQTQIRGSATLDGAHIRVVFDSGAGRSVLTQRAARRAGIRTDDSDVVRAGVSYGIAKAPIENWIAPISSFDIGGEQVKTTHLRIADLELDDADMLLGADFFLSHRILISLTQSKAYFTYNGGPVFDLGAPVPGVAAQSPTAPTAAQAATQPDPGGVTPTDAAGFSRRGAAFAARHEFDQAIADFTRAAELEPQDPKHVFDRGAARVQNRQLFLAMDDFNQALKLKPDYVPALMLRGEVKLAGKDRAGAQADFDAALKADPSVQLRIANAYVASGAFEDALAGYDTWLASHPKSEDLAAPLGGRCRARAFLNRDLDKALADCNESLALSPGAPQVLGSRGLVELRLGQYDKAIADCSAALNVQPRNVWALYGRGLARLKKGDADGGAADIAAATAIQPTLPQQARNVGLAS